jgi:hypothetical protein
VPPIVGQCVQPAPVIAACHIHGAKVHVLIFKGSQFELSPGQAHVNAGLMLHYKLTANIFHVKPWGAHHVFETHILKGKAQPALEYGGGHGRVAHKAFVPIINQKEQNRLIHSKD